MLPAKQHGNVKPHACLVITCSALWHPPNHVTQQLSDHLNHTCTIQLRKESKCMYTNNTTCWFLFDI